MRGALCTKFMLVAPVVALPGVAAASGSDWCGCESTHGLDLAVVPSDGPGAPGVVAVTADFLPFDYECDYSLEVEQTVPLPDPPVAVTSNQTVFHLAGCNPVCDTDLDTVTVSLPKNVDASENADVQVRFVETGATVGETQSCTTASKVCVIPSGDKVGATGWCDNVTCVYPFAGFPTTFKYSVKLAPVQAKFHGGRFLREAIEYADPMQTTGRCVDPGHTLPSCDDLVVGTDVPVVLSNGSSGYTDYVGIPVQTLAGYRAFHITPCHCAMSQSMAIDCPWGEDGYLEYDTHVMTQAFDEICVGGTDPGDALCPDGTPVAGGAVYVRKGAKKDERWKVFP